MNKLNHLKQQLKERGARFPIYLDYQSTTPLDPRVVEDMLPYFTEKFGNPDSKSHAFGWEAESAVELARTHVASLIGTEKNSIIFTSSATEANNLALFGIVDSVKHIITLSTEHKSVLEPLRQIEQQGMKVTYLPVQPNGLVDLEILENTMSQNKTLVSIMAVHNEIGVIQPIEEIGEICRKYNAIFHSDIAQAFGKIPIDVAQHNIDLASISGHKIYGPKGIGALYVRRGLKLKPLMYGGGQENGLRPSTLATPLIVSLGRTSEIAMQEMDQDQKHIKKLYDIFVDMLQLVPEFTINGDKDKRWPGNININLPIKNAGSFMATLKSIAISSGAACASSSTEKSYVLQSLGLGDKAISCALRIGFGKFTTKEEVEYAALTILNNLDI